MAKGKELGAFSHKFISTTVLPGPAGSMLSQTNWEGGAIGFGTIFITATFLGGKSGTFSSCGADYLDDGSQRTGHGTGTYESAGTHVWRTEEIVHISDGSTMVAEGRIDLAARSWVGKIYQSI
jgi:hypothetical protein